MSSPKPKIWYNYFTMFTPMPQEVLSQWHPTLNRDLKPEIVSKWSKIQVWWVCSNGHEWKTSVEARFRKGGRISGCAFCSGRKTLKGFNDLAITHPILASQWHPTKNGELKPDHVGMGDSHKVWWLGKCGHEWEASVGNRSNVKNGTNCPYCAGSKVLVGFNDLATTNPVLAGEWHPTKNGELKPTNFTKGSTQGKVWWLGKCGHEWEASIGKRNNGHGCHYCTSHKSLKGFNDLVSLCPGIAAEWHPTKNEEFVLGNVTASNSRKFWWQCKKGHEWQTTVSSRTSKTKATNCPYCGNKKIIAGENDFAFLCPSIAAEWHSTKNGKLKPSQVSRGSNRKVWWQCEKGHEWQTTVGVRVNRGDGCPSCGYRISQAELTIVGYLEQLGLKVENSNRKVLNGKELDIFVPDKSFAVEFNGLYWHSEKQGKDETYHYDKWKACKDQGIELVQVWEDDWNRNPELIKAMLAAKLGVSTQPKIDVKQTQVVVLTAKQAKSFLNQNHVKGFVSGTQYLGLTEQGDIEKLVAVLILKKETKSSTGNIVRYATSVNVMGGFTKLLNHAETTYTPERFITFSDNCVSDDGLYESNGFVFSKELKPDYMLLVKNERKSKFGYVTGSFSRVWDAGRTCWVKECLLR